jgi:hypothetical protein
MKASDRQLMARELADWHHAGLIDAGTAAALAPRYDRDGQMLAAALKWLGLFAIFQLGLAVLSFIGIMSRSELVGAMLLAAASAGTLWWGIRLATDPAARHPVTGSALITVALAGAFGSAVLLALAAGLAPRYGHLSAIMLLVALLAGLVAYRFRLRWPLMLGLLLAFHGLGTWHAYGGHGAYFADIQEPRAMAPLALLVACIGIWHEQVAEQRLAPRTVGFGHMYLILGLLYLNLSLWFLSLERGALAWVLVFSAAALAQIVAGARLHDSRLTGFGIVFLSIDLYTRFFERFWDSTRLATLLCLCGAAGMLIGTLIERRRTPS